MAGKRKAPAKNGRRKKTSPELVWDEGYWWIVSGTVRTNVGRSRRYAEKMLSEHS